MEYLLHLRHPVRMAARAQEMQRDGAPADYAELRAAIVARHAALPKRLAQAADFAVRHPDEIAFGTVASIAGKAGVQPSTLIRFAQAMGYQGFSELQAVFRSRLRERAPDYEARLQALSESGAGSKAGLLLEGFCEASERSLAGLRGSIDPAVLQAAVKTLAKARTIYLVGLRRSFPVAAYLAYACGKLGIRNVLVDAVAGLAPETAGFAEPGDALVAISFTPYSSETAAIASEAAARGVPVVALTDSPFSPLAQSATLWFEVVEAHVEGFRTLSASLALSMTLAVAVAEHRRGNS
jgi:DNA-binding MurR/RpiR family transcriptional regulator